MDRNYDAITIISKYPDFKRPGVVIFAHIIKIVTMFFKKITKDSEKLKELEIMYQKSNLYVYFLM